MDANTVAILGTLISAAAGLAGAYIGGRYTLRAGTQAHQNQLALQRASQSEQLNGVLQALYEELSALWDVYMSEAGRELEGLKDGESFLVTIPVTQDYFTVFKSNVPYVGMIEDAELRRLIVRSYMKAAGVIDSIRLNNSYLEAYNAAAAAETDLTTIGQRFSAEENLKSYAKVMVENHYQTKALVEQTLNRLEGRFAGLQRGGGSTPKS